MKSIPRSPGTGQLRYFPRAEMSFASHRPLVPVVGAIPFEPEPAYPDRAMHQVANDAIRNVLSGPNGAPADTAPCEPFGSQKLLILARATLPARQRQRPDPVQHVTEQPPVQMPLRQEQPVIARVLDQSTARLH